MRDRIKKIPVIGSTLTSLARVPVIARVHSSLAFPGSSSYWETRYRAGGSSGAGSYGPLSEFKAAILNEFVRSENIRTVIEFGCGDGAQLQLARYPEYVGIDVSATVIGQCTARFAHDHSKRFYLYGALPDDLGRFDLALSLDVIYHLVEDSVFDTYMRALFEKSHRHVAIYASNFDGATETPHVRHRQFTHWVTRNAREWRLARHIPNRFPFDPNRLNETSFADFYFFAR